MEIHISGVVTNVIGRNCAAHGEAANISVSQVVMVEPTRFERVTPGLGIRCSIQLSYGSFWTFYYCNITAVRNISTS